MSKPNDQDQHHQAQRDVQAPGSSRRAWLDALLFGGAALGTALLMFAGAHPKIPPAPGRVTIRKFGVKFRSVLHT